MMYMDHQPTNRILCSTLKPPKSEIFFKMTEYDKIKLHIATLPKSDSPNLESSSLTTIGINSLLTDKASIERAMISKRSDPNSLSLFDGCIEFSSTELNTINNLHPNRSVSPTIAGINSTSNNLTTQIKLTRINNMPTTTTIKPIYPRGGTGSYNQAHNVDPIDVDDNADFLPSASRTNTSLSGRTSIPNHFLQPQSSSQTSRINSIEPIVSAENQSNSDASISKSVQNKEASQLSLETMLNSKPKETSSESSNKRKLLSKPSTDTISRPTEPSTSSSSSSKKQSTGKASSNHDASQPKLTIPFTIEDFQGVGGFCRNVGSSRAGYDNFSSKIMSSSEVVLSLIWNDLTTNHVTTSVKYCTPSVHCSVWHCSCDRHIRVEQAYRPLIGVAAMFPDESSIAYFIALSQSAGSGDAEHVDSDAFTLPLNCAISLSERWQLMENILGNQHLTKVLYNSPIFMLPIIHHMRQSSSSGDIQDIKNLYDPRIAQYVIQTTTVEADLELKSLLGAYNVQPLTNSADDLPSPSPPSSNIGRVAKKIKKMVEEMSMLLRVHQATRDRLQNTNMLQVFQDSEMPTSLLLTHMELCGVCVSSSAMQHLKALITDKIDQVTKSAHRAAKSSFNLGSSSQVAEILYNQLKLPPPPGSSSSKRHHSTSEEDLLRIRDRKPDIIDAILAYRTLSKIMSNNIDGLSTFLRTHRSTYDHTNLITKRVHAIWNQTTVRTGRLSCCKPNLQNIPNTIEDVAGVQVNVRSLFTASPGYVLIAADYSQIEIRVMSQISGDEQLQHLLKEGGDIYKQLAAAIFSKPMEDVDDQERGRAKTVCLGTMYGMGTISTASKLGIEVAGAKRIIAAFFDRFQQLHDWMERTKSTAREVGYVSTLMGRRRYIPEIRSMMPMEIAQGERQAVNTIIQGTASDLLKKAMLAVEERMLCWPNPETKPRIILQIHDELIYEMKVSNDSMDMTEQQGQDITAVSQHDEVRMFVQLLTDCMETISGWSIPTPTNIQIGYTWGNMMKYPHPYHNQPDMTIDSRHDAEAPSIIAPARPSIHDTTTSNHIEPSTTISNVDSQPTKKARRSVD